LTLITAITLIPFQSIPFYLISSYTFLDGSFNLPICGAIIDDGPASPPKIFTFTAKIRELNIL